MVTGNNPLAKSILYSSIWVEDHATRLVWITMLAAMDEHGVVQAATTRNIAAIAHVSPDEAESAVAKLEAPDPFSTNPAHDGRRIERIIGGWRVLNAQAFRGAPAASATLKRPRGRPKLVKADVGPDFDAFWRLYPNKANKERAKASWASLQPDATLLARILAAVSSQKKTQAWIADGGKFVPHASTYIDNRRWQDIEEQAPAEATPQIDHEAERSRKLLEERGRLLQRRRDA